MNGEDSEDAESERLLGSEEGVIGVADTTEEDLEPSSSDCFLGAKPKVRVPEELKKRRRVLKKAHSISHSPVRSQSSVEPKKQSSFDGRSIRTRRASSEFLPPLKPIVIPNLETHQEQVKLQGTGDEPTPTKRACPEFFGVRSYLHTFYESVSIGNPGMYEDFGEPEYRYLIAPAKKRRAACLWKIALWLGINLLAFGLVMILVGYLVPKRDIVVGQEDDMEIIDKTAMRFNSNLDLCKLIGLVVFCIGGTTLVAVLLFPSLMNQYCDEEPLGWSPEEFRVQVGGYQEPPKTPTEKKVPVTEELANIQPKDKEGEKMVMTNSGLCKIP